MATFTDVVDWVEGRLGPERAERVRGEVEADESLREAVTWLRRFRQAAAAEPWQAPPARVRAHLVHRFALERPAPPPLVERLRAAVTFDSALAQPVAGVRSAAPTTARHLVVSTEDLDVALDLYPEDRDVRVEGQVLPVAETGDAAADVELSRGGGTLARTAADASGRFALPPVPAGPVLLVVGTAAGAFEVLLDLEV